MVTIATLPDSSVDELTQAIESSPITSESKDMAANIAGHVHGIAQEELDDIVDLIYALYHVREYTELSKSRFITELVDGLREQAKDPRISSSDTSQLRKRFERLLSLGTLDTITKAITLQRNGERLFCDAQILSDLRPVFGDDVKQKPRAVVITHTLKLSYHEEGDHKSFFIVLDEVDLNALSDVVERAKAKADTLTALIKKDVSIPRLGV